MKKIQLITVKPDKYTNFNQDIEINNFNNLLSLDNYEINVFDLNTNEIWNENSKITANPTGNMPLIKDFKSICQMINNSKKTKIVLCLPQNLKYCCKYYDENKYFELKNIINILKLVLEQISSVKFDTLFYENTITEINGKNVSGAFVFSEHENMPITQSKDSLKYTTIQKNNIIFTTLNLLGNKDINLLINFLKQIGIIRKTNEFPKWLQEFKFNDDEELLNSIINAEIEIDKFNKIIIDAKLKLDENMKYKSILVNNSDELTKVIYEIIEYIFDIDLSTFADVKKEDFLFEKNNISYIGEIKGVTSNIRSEHISQLDVHYYSYLDRLQEEGIQKDIRKLLIMNYERNKNVINRTEVHQIQIDLAIRNSTLIIDSLSLLKLYEGILKGIISKQKAIDYLNTKTGLFNIDDLAGVKI